MNFDFKELAESDLPLINDWLQQPHVSKWFDTNEWINEISSNLISDWVCYFRAELDSIPIGFTQYYNTSKAPKGPWSSQPAGTIGIDFFIGNPSFLGKGHGILLVNNFVEFVINNVNSKRIIADPDKDNIKSQHILKKCGFRLEKKTGLYIKT